MLHALIDTISGTGFHVITFGFSTILKKVTVFACCPTIFVTKHQTFTTRFSIVITSSAPCQLTLCVINLKTQLVMITSECGVV